MRYLLRNKDTGVVHSATPGQRGKIMLTRCGLAVRPGTGRWFRKPLTARKQENWVNCKRCGRG